jgi:tungstate transport system substrate-binding protein
MKMLKMHNGAALLILFYIVVTGFTGCTMKQAEIAVTPESTLKLATTTTTVDSGLIDVLIPAFEDKYNVTTEVIVKGTGAVLQLAKTGKADVVIVHARKAEDKFIAEGYGVNRRDIMFSEFIILGPPLDPIQIQAKKDVLSALKAISEQGVKFYSRGDDSGTHMREKELWNLLEIEPSGDWYKESKTGMKETLKLASESKSHILSEKSTYLFNQEELDLVIIVEGGKHLFNPYGVIAVNPTKVPGVNYKAAMQFIDFITSIEEGQEIISGHGRPKFNNPLFNIVD